MITITRPRLLGAAAVFQLLLVGVLLVGAKAPLVRGQEIVVPVHPVDPRSLFRGNYAALRYDFTDLDGPLADGLPHGLERGDGVYVSLERDGGVWQPVAAGTERPEGLFLRGRVEWTARRQTRVRYGLEAFFAPTEVAQELERRVRVRPMVAVLRVAPSGRAALVDVREARPDEVPAKE